MKPEPTPAASPLAPGFEFLQTLAKSATAALPQMGQWVAPTVNVQDLEKRIGELRTVQFWLEQNARMLSATIQALEVQRMTLSALQAMNVPMKDVRESAHIKTSASATKAAAVETEGGAVDPLKWWGALTQQFSDLASTALKDTAAPSMAPQPDSKPQSAQPTMPRRAAAAKKSAQSKSNLKPKA
jgi:hypothetical protein